MVDKIDKTEPVSPYYIHSTAEADKDGGRHPQEQQSSDEYSGHHAAPGWQRIYAAASNRRYMKLRQSDILRVWFRATTMQKGIALAEVDLALKDGRLIKNAHLILTREDFWTLKRYQPGQDVPLNIIIRSMEVEVSVPGLKGGQDTVVGAGPATRQAEEKGTGTAKGFAGGREWMIYAAIGAVLFIVLLYIFLR